LQVSGLILNWKENLFPFQLKYDDLEKSLKTPFSVFPAKTGIQSFRQLANF